MIHIMKYNGSAVGKSGRRYYFNKGQEIDADKGEFTKEVADVVVEEVKKRGRKPKEEATKKDGEKAVE